MNNIDEDIKILEKLVSKKYDDKLLNTLDMVTEEDEVYVLTLSERQAIENVITELETYKKIAEKLVSYGESYGLDVDIDWARNEVENGN